MAHLSDSGFSPGAEAVFSIIVGINQYKAKDVFGALNGAVNDAESFKTFLTDSRRLKGLQVPSSHIKSLTNEKATRSAILSTFKSHFLDNQDIPDHGNAAMIFFFAGHGSRVDSPNNLLPYDSKVEVICPFDERTRGPDKKYVHAIPDFVLGQLSHELAEKKGNNITVILDSCHSGGMGRNDAKARNARAGSRPVPPGLDEHLFENNGITARPYKLWNPSAASHVLLAACRQNGKAYESWSAPFNGHFTRCLITELRRARLDDITYAELINRLPSLPMMQRPQCGGANKDRLIFTTAYPGIGRRALPITQQLLPDPNGGNEKLRVFLISMGSVEGIRPGTEFSVYGAENNTAVLCTLVGQSVKIHQTILASEDGGPVKIPEGSRALMKNWKNTEKILRVHTCPEFQFTSSLFEASPASPHNYVRVDSFEAAHISLKSDGLEVVVEWLTGPLAQLPSAREVRFSMNSDIAKPLHLPSVLGGVAHFRYFLERQNGSFLLSDFALQMHRLKGQYPNRKPDLSVGDNLIAAGKIALKPDKYAKYGFTMRNTSQEDLFPYLFYFEPLNCTIQPWYIPETSHGRPPLHRNSGQVTVGMGGEPAFEFWLSPGQRSIAGFIKMFVSTEYLDLGWIEQSIPPFDPRFEGTARLLGNHEMLQRRSEWNALCVVLTMEV
ncbi:hypothetical protein FB451DRAFT_1138849 [Mycena latifolia]|nr:hypothetical protein FB451DRAFT_1138849 [Mycena latifolia]